jgi:hypothetical protein
MGIVDQALRDAVPPNPETWGESDEQARNARLAEQIAGGPARPRPATAD